MNSSVSEPLPAGHGDIHAAYAGNLPFDTVHSELLQHSLLEQLCSVARQVCETLGSGDYDETMYHKTLVAFLRNRYLRCEEQEVVNYKHEGRTLGGGRLDFVVSSPVDQHAEQVVVEVKASKSKLTEEQTTQGQHRAKRKAAMEQLERYMKHTKRPLGVVIFFSQTPVQGETRSELLVACECDWLARWIVRARPAATEPRGLANLRAWLACQSGIGTRLGLPLHSAVSKCKTGDFILHPTLLAEAGAQEPQPTAKNKPAGLPQPAIQRRKRAARSEPELPAGLPQAQRRKRTARSEPDLSHLIGPDVKHGPNCGYCKTCREHVYTRGDHDYKCHTTVRPDICYKLGKRKPKVKPI